MPRSRVSISIFSRCLLKRPKRLDEGEGKDKSTTLIDFAFHTDFSPMLLYQPFGYG